MVTHTQERTEVHLTTEERGEQTIETELIDRIGAVIEQSQSNSYETGAAQEAATPETDRDRQEDHPLQLEPATQDAPAPEHDHEQPHTADRDERDRDTDRLTREQPNEREIDQDRDNNLGYGIE